MCRYTDNKIIGALTTYFSFHRYAISLFSRNIFKVHSYFIHFLLHPCMHVCVCVCARVYVCVCVCVRPFTVKASSVWISWSTSEQINDVLLKTLLSSACPFITTLE